MPRRVTVAAGCPTAALPVSQTRMVSARSRSGLARDERLQPAGALFLRPLDDQFQVHRHVVAERPQGEQMREDVALAVGGAPAVPAAVHLGEFEGRGAPGGIIEGWLHVVVRVEQHGRRIRVGSRPRPDHRVGCRPASARGGHPRIRARRTCRAPTARPWRTPPGGTAGGPPPTGCATNSASSSRAGRIRSVTRERRSMAHRTARVGRFAGRRRTSGTRPAPPGSRPDDPQLALQRPGRPRSPACVPGPAAPFVSWPEGWPGSARRSGSRRPRRRRRRAPGRSARARAPSPRPASIAAISWSAFSRAC